MTRYRDLIAVSLVGLSVGVLVAFDSYGTFFTGHQIGVRLLPFTFSLLAFVLGCFLLASVILFVKYFPVFMQKKELLFIPMFLTGYQMNAISIGVLDPGDFAIGLFMFVFIIGLLATENSTLVITPLSLMSLLLVGFIFIPIIYTVLPVRTQFLYVKTFFMYILIINFLHSGELFKKAIKWLLSITAWFAAFGIFQELFYIVTRISLVGNIPKAELERMYEATSFGYLLRVPGLMMSYRSFALILAVGLLITISLMLFPKTEIFRKRGYLYLNACLFSIALFFTFSKDIMVGFFMAMCIMFILWRPKLLLHLITVGLLAAALVLALFAYLPGKVDNFNYVFKDIPKSEHERMQLDREGIERYINGPFKVFGRGAERGNRYTGHVLGWPAHNAFILIADEIGIFALLLYAGMFCYAFYRIIVLNIKINDPVYRPIALGLLCGLIVHLVGAQFTANYVEPLLWLHYGFIEVLWLLDAKEQPAVA